MKVFQFCSLLAHILESESLSILDSVGADGRDQKEGRFVMNSPLSELADQSIPMSRISALPVARNLRIAALVEYNLVYSLQYIYGSAISIWLNIKCNGSPMQMWWFGTEVVCNSLQMCGLCGTIVIVAPLPTLVATTCHPGTLAHPVSI